MLVKVDIPQLDNISKLRFAIFAQKPILYEYYANTDRSTFLKKFAENKEAIKAGLYLIPRDDQGQAFLSQIEFLTAQITTHAEQLDQTLNSSSIDWDKARDILGDVSGAESKVTPLIDAFVSLNQKQVSNIAEQAESRVQLNTILVTGFCVLLLLAAALLSRNIKHELAK